jgi:hypothetical protein
MFYAPFHFAGSCDNFTSKGREFVTEYSFLKMFFTKWQKFATNKSLVESCQSCIYGEILSPLGVVMGSICYPVVISICQPKGSSPSHCAKRKYSLGKALKITI